MRIEVKTMFDCTFQVVEHTQTEGGMDTDHYGGECSTIEQALHRWAQAMTEHPTQDWFILCMPIINVTRTA